MSSMVILTRDQDKAMIKDMINTSKSSMKVNTELNRFTRMRTQQMTWQEDLTSRRRNKNKSSMNTSSRRKKKKRKRSNKIRSLNNPNNKMMLNPMSSKTNKKKSRQLKRNTLKKSAT